MKTVTAIIKARGGLAALRRAALKIENPGFMDLHIEYVGTGPRNLPMVSVAHYYVQNGDLMRDPDMEFEVDPKELDADVTPKTLSGEGWYPLTYRQDGLGIIHIEEY